jgi:hypothetical protein
MKDHSRKLNEEELRHCLNIINNQFDTVHTFTSISNVLFDQKYLAFRPVLLDESTERGVRLMDIESKEITQLFIPDDFLTVIGIDVSQDGSQLLLSLAGEEPDTPECIIINVNAPDQPIELDCEGIWYEGFGSALKWGAEPDELLVINDFDPDETTPVQLNLKDKEILIK